MKRSVIGLMVFIVAVAFAGLSKAEEETYYAGEIIDYEEADRRKDQDGVKFHDLREITIKEENGDIRKFKFKIKEVTVNRFKFEFTEDTVNGFPPKFTIRKGMYVWLEVKFGTPTFIALLPEGVTVQQIEKTIRDIRQEAQNNLTREGSSPKEHEIMYEAWRITSMKTWLPARKSQKELLEQIQRYFWSRYCRQSQKC